jgi:DNA (cytosine-5)-methyltransferase 1
MRLLDLFCGAGGAGMGYYCAGFEVVGVDINPQPHYPFEFHQADALEYLVEHGTEFDVIHASPPCQAFTAMQHICKNAAAHPDLVDPVRRLLIDSGKPYIIENVVGAPLRTDLLLCGTMLGLPIIRHRIFESNIHMPLLTTTCHHDNVYDPWHGVGGVGQREKLSEAMGIDWFMTRKEVREAIPPAYTEWIGKQILAAILAKYPAHPKKEEK